MSNPYNTGLDRNPANYQPLTPLTFLERAASVFPEHTAIIHGAIRRNYDEFYRGGYTHTVDDTTRAALIAGNVGVTSANFTAL